MNKKHITAFSALVLLLVLFAGCTGNKPGNKPAEQPVAKQEVKTPFEIGNETKALLKGS